MELSIRIVGAGAAFLSFMFMSFVISWTLIDIVTFNMR